MDNFEFDLNAMLEELAPEIAVTEREEQEAAGGIPFINFYQNMSKPLKGWASKPLGHAVITLNTSGDKADVVLLQNPIFWVLDSLVKWERVSTRGKHYYRGGRSIWDYDPATGNSKNENNAPVCKSPDGKAPNERHIGHVFTFPKGHQFAGGQHVVGYEMVERDGAVAWEPVENAEEICDKCPMSKWTTRIVDGVSRQVKPMCADVWSFVLWFPPQTAKRPTGNMDQPYEKFEWAGGQAILQGSPNSVQLAIEGASGDSRSGELSGRDLPEFMSFLRQNGNAEHLIEKSKLHDKLMPLVIGFQKTEKSKEVVEASEEAFANPDLKYAVLKVPAYPYAQEGEPEVVMDFNKTISGMRYLQWEVVQNKYTGNPYVPLFGLSDKPVNPLHYMEFLKAKKQFKNEEVHARLMGGSNLTVVAQKLLASGAPNIAGALPAGNTASAIEDLSDM